MWANKHGTCFSTGRSGFCMSYEPRHWVHILMSLHDYLYSEQLQCQRKRLSWAQAKSAYCMVTRTHTVSTKRKMLKRKPPPWKAEEMLAWDLWPTSAQLHSTVGYSSTTEMLKNRMALQLRLLLDNKSSVYYVLQREGYIIYIP